MNKAWAQSIVYFLNVLLHLGIFWVLFTVSIPENFTTLEFIIDFWSYPEGKEVIYFNSALLCGNLIFALMILFYANKSLSVSITFTVLSWVLALLLFYFLGYNDHITNYILGAGLLSYFTYDRYKKNA